MNMKTQLATIRITGAVEKSTAVMASMSRLIKIPELQKTMTQMSKEMTKMGIIDEMMDDAMSSLDPEDIEEAADTEVLGIPGHLVVPDSNFQIEKVLYELTEGAIGSMPAAGSTNLPTAEAEEEDEIDDDMLNRLAGLRA